MDEEERLAHAARTSELMKRSSRHKAGQRRAGRHYRRGRPLLASAYARKKAWWHLRRSGKDPATDRRAYDLRARFELRKYS